MPAAEADRSVSNRLSHNGLWVYSKRMGSDAHRRI